MKNIRLISLGIGLLIGSILGGVAVWSMTKNFVDKAVMAAEERFDSLLEEEKEKLQGKVDDANKLKERLEVTLNETESKVDSLNTTIQNRNKHDKNNLPQYTYWFFCWHTRSKYSELITVCALIDDLICKV